MQQVVNNDASTADGARDPYGGRIGQLKRAGAMALIGLPILAVLLSSFPICPMAGSFGVPCPGCGLTRATVDLLHGNLSAALHMQPLVLLVSPLYIGGVLSGVYVYIRGPMPIRNPSTFSRWFGRIIGPVAGVTFALLIILWVARFFGYFGGPVPVETFHHWFAHHH